MAFADAALAGSRAIQQILLQRELAKRQALADQLTQQREGRAERELSMRGDELAFNRDRQAKLDASTEQQRVSGEANTIGDQIPPGAILEPSDPSVGILTRGGRAGLLTKNKTLPSTQMTGAQLGDLTETARPSDNVTQSVTKLPSQKQIDTNTDNERQAATQKFQQESTQWMREHTDSRDKATDAYRAATLRQGQERIDKPSSGSAAPPDSGDVSRAAAVVLGKKMSPSQAIAAFGGMGTDAARFKRAMNLEIVKQNPDFDFQAAESNYQFGKNPTTQSTVRYIDNLNKSVPILKQASADFKRGNIKIINRASLAAQAQTGDPKAQAYDFALTIFADEIAKILQGGGTGNGTSDAKLKQAQDILGSDMSPAQLDAVLAVAQDMMSSRRGSLTSGTYMEQPEQTPQPTSGSGFKVLGVR